MILKKSKNIILICTIFFIAFSFCFQLTGCRNYDKSVDINYYFKTEPEKAVIDFFQALNNHDLGYIYDNFLLKKDKDNISGEKFINDFSFLLSNMESITVKKTVYLGFENDMSKVVAEFDIKYKDGQDLSYKKYIYLLQENDKWKIVFDKTFI